MLVTACCMQVTNQRVGKQCAVICAEAGAFYGRRAEVSLADYFLARGVPACRVGGGKRRSLCRSRPPISRVLRSSRLMEREMGR